MKQHPKRTKQRCRLEFVFSLVFLKLVANIVHHQTTTLEKRKQTELDLRGKLGRLQAANQVHPIEEARLKGSTAQEAVSHRKIVPDANEVRPNLIIHFGPGKTGSTSIQCAIQSFKEELLQDGYSVFHTQACNDDAIENRKAANILELSECLRLYTSENHLEDLLPCFDYYREQFQTLRQSGRSVIISDELLFEATNFRLTKFIDFLTGIGFRVSAAVTYRHFFDRKLSEHTQRYKHIPDRWVSENEGFTKTIDFLHQEVNASRTNPFLKVASIPNVSSFHLLDFHAGDLVCTFFCSDVLPGAHNACKRCKSEPPFHKNEKTWYFMFDSVALAAKRRGMVTDACRRINAAPRLQAILLNTTQRLRDFPLICPSAEQLAPVWNITEAIGKSAQQYKVASSTGVIDLKKVRSDFENMVESGLLCEFNTREMFRKGNKRFKPSIKFALLRCNNADLASTKVV